MSIINYFVSLQANLLSTQDMSKHRTTVVVLFLASLMLMLSSWDGGRSCLIGPIPQRPLYDDSTQWYIQDRGGVADIFYVISTETGDHLMGGDTCHFADTYDMALRKAMLVEMAAVDSFYSDKLNYYSPYYRQVSMQSWTSQDTAMARIPIALSDVRRSWEYYLTHFNQGRPFVLAGFSQGACAVKQLIKEMPDSVYKRMIAAYVIGYHVTQDELDRYPNIIPAQGATDLGVTVCFNSVRSADCAIPIVSEGNVACINPVNWRTDTVCTPFVSYGRHKNDTLAVHCDTLNRLLVVDGYRERTLLPVIGRSGNYHNMELKFYYPYIRQNIADRVAAYMSITN